MNTLMIEHEKLIPKHGGYRKLKSFQLAQLIYDVTVRFCQRYVDSFGRMRDQMIQAARSGVQNIAEGSQASATSKKTELKLTSVARARLEGLRLDFEDYLRQCGLPQFKANRPVLKRFKERRCSTMDDLRAWLKEEQTIAINADKHRRSQTNTDSTKTALLSVNVSENLCSSVLVAVLVANAELCLLNLCCHLLDRQLAALAKAFEQDGGFTERLYRIRQKTVSIGVIKDHNS